ncbi:RES family NAD+ phosphorylase [Duganella sp. FT27W]|uniref:RES family NAD+ phosphorylase n=1 Tax=Duganella sp. FT27W TaxID=2654636 RepID=UPI00128DA426|nr:RES family NAD+ phosphorylase [Duganella sp. FT27W]MPQ55203.1 RES domain-containing protein [Duganella sp. FT27W]
MRLWRIAHRKYALDRHCSGAAMYGGRWNPIGLPALYCGSTIAITSLEKLVHLGTTPWPPLVLVAVDLPDASAVYAPDTEVLPDGWDALPLSTTAQSFGGDWLRRGDTLTMKIPSVIVPEEANFVINPMHPDYPQVQLTALRPFSFDRRLAK